jgi:hypothetical protein
MSVEEPTPEKKRHIYPKAQYDPSEWNCEPLRDFTEYEINKEPPHAIRHIEDKYVVPVSSNGYVRLFRNGNQPKRSLKTLIHKQWFPDKYEAELQSIEDPLTAEPFLEQKEAIIEWLGSLPKRLLIQQRIIDNFDIKLDSLYEQHKNLSALHDTLRPLIDNLNDRLTKLEQNK